MIVEKHDLILKSFIDNLVKLGSQLSKIFKEGTMSIRSLEEMNVSVEGLRAAQKEGGVDEITLVEEDLKAIYYNFNAIVQMIESQESRFMDNTTMKAVNTFLRNVNAAVVNIATVYGLV